MPFAPGSAALGAEAQQRVDTLGKALAERPALKLDIGGRADPAADREALRRAAVESAMKHEKMKSLAAAGDAPASVELVTIGADERDSLAHRRLSRVVDQGPPAQRDRHAQGPSAGRDGGDAARRRQGRR